MSQQEQTKDQATIEQQVPVITTEDSKEEARSEDLKVVELSEEPKDQPSNAIAQATIPSETTSDGKTEEVVEEKKEETVENVTKEEVSPKKREREEELETCKKIKSELQNSQEVEVGSS